MLAEAVGNACFYVGYDVGLGVDGKWDFAAIRAEVVHAAYVVVMAVGDEQRVEVKVGGAEHLLPEIGSAVNQQADALRAHDGGAAQAFVARVVGGASGALAAYLRDAGGCACAQER